MNEKETGVLKCVIFLSVGEVGGMRKITLRENRSINIGNVRNAAIKQQSEEERPANVTDEWPDEGKLH